MMTMVAVTSGSAWSAPSPARSPRGPRRRRSWARTRRPFRGRILDEALDRLEAGADAVFTPAEDGGYVLVALRGAHPELFRDVAWGTGTVALATRVRARVAGLRLEETAPWRDVDLPADLDALPRDLALDPLRAPATARALASLPR